MHTCAATMRQSRPSASTSSTAGRSVRSAACARSSCANVRHSTASARTLPASCRAVQLPPLCSWCGCMNLSMFMTRARLNEPICVLQLGRPPPRAVTV
eukprot:scaffold68734_cov63-Phaeocystis_antarctica.AAC.2